MDWYFNTIDGNSKVSVQQIRLHVGFVLGLDEVHPGETAKDMKKVKDDIFDIIDNNDDNNDTHTRSASALEKGIERTPWRTYLRFLVIGTFLMTSTQ